MLQCFDTNCCKCVPRCFERERIAKMTFHREYLVEYNLLGRESSSCVFASERPHSAEPSMVDLGVTFQALEL